MRSDVLRRVRWGNVARVVVVAVVVGAIVAWPRLTPPAPSLPGGEARPLVEPAPRTEVKRRDRARARRGHLELKPRVRRRDRSRAAAPAEVVAPPEPAPGASVAPSEAPTGGGAVPAPPVDDPAQVEFGIEGG
jgi:hypothetical protein